MVMKKDPALLFSMLLPDTQLILLCSIPEKSEAQVLGNIIYRNLENSIHTHNFTFTAALAAGAPQKEIVIGGCSAKKMREETFALACVVVASSTPLL